MPSEPSKAGIVTDESSGERHIPESVRPDGSTRKAIKIRPGYRPPEDVEVYKNRTADAFRNRGKGGVPGAEGLKDDSDSTTKTTTTDASNKNAKRREARKKAKAAGDDAESAGASAGAGAGAGAGASATTAAAAPPAEEEVVDPAVEREKKARNLKKKLKQAKDLKNKKDTGEALLPEQIAKVIKISELIRELDALGFDAEGEPKPAEEVGGKDEVAS